MHFLGFQVIKEKLMACIIFFFVGSGKKKQTDYYVFPYCSFTNIN